MNLDDFPLNINLIIPFKDKKRDGLRNDLSIVEAEMKKVVEKLNLEISDTCGEDFKLSILAKRAGKTTRYYWRFKSSKNDRSFKRIYDPAVKEYLETKSSHMQLFILDMENILNIINANLIAIAGIKHGMEFYEDEFNKIHGNDVDG